MHKVLLDDLGITDLSPFLAYLDLLSRWNKIYNLTAIRDKTKMFSYHILDSLALIPYIQGKTILDVGSGAGLPGIPLALYFPEKQVTLLECQNKKYQFLSTVQRQLPLNNVTVVHQRVEAFFPQKKYDTIVMRAVGKIATYMALTRHVIAEQGVWLFMKGRIPHDELNELSCAYQIKMYQVPSLKAARCIICVRMDDDLGSYTT